MHGAPLVLKRDRGSNLRHKAVQALLEAGREAMKVYTRPGRKEVIDWIRNEALAIIETDGLARADARAVPIHRDGNLVTPERGHHRLGGLPQVLPSFPEKWSHK